MAADKKQVIEFIDEKERELFAAAQLGESARDFLRHNPVGRYLHHRAKQQIRQAEVDALEVNPDGFSWLRSRTKLRQIRQRADVARAFINWLGEAILDGDNAAQQLDDYRSE